MGLDQAQVYCSVQYAAEYEGVSEVAIKKRIYRQTLPAVKIKGVWHIPISALVNFAPTPPGRKPRKNKTST